MTVLNPTRRQRAAQWVLGSDALLVGADDYAKVRDERESVTTRLREEALFDQLATNVIEWHEAMVRFAARLSSGVALSTRETWARTEQECSLMLRIANVLSAAFSFSEAVERNGRHRKHGCGDSIKHAAYDESAMTETGYSLRIPGVKERIPISQEDYERARDTLALMEERLQEETLFDQLAVLADSPESETIYVQGTIRMSTEIMELRERNRRLPDLELVQFGGGSPTQGDLRMLLERIEQMVERAGNRDLTVAEARSRFELDLSSQETTTEPITKLARRLHR